MALETPIPTEAVEETQVQATIEPEPQPEPQPIPTGDEMAMETTTKVETEFPKPEEELAPIETETTGIDGLTSDDDKKKVKQSLLDSFYKKVESNPDYNIYQAQADFSKEGIDEQMFDALAQYANTRKDNTYELATLNKMFTKNFGYEVESDAAIGAGKQVPGGATAGTSGGGELKSAKPVEIDKKAEQAKIQKELKAYDLPETKYTPPKGYTLNKDGTVTLPYDAAYAIREYQLRTEQVKEGENIKKNKQLATFAAYGSPVSQGLTELGLSMGIIDKKDLFFTEQNEKDLQNRKKLHTKSVKEALPIISEIGKALVANGNYKKYLNIQVNKDGRENDFTIDAYAIADMAEKEADIIFESVKDSTAYGDKDEFRQLLEEEIEKAAQFAFIERYASKKMEEEKLPILKQKYPEVFSKTALINKFLEQSKEDEALLKKSQTELSQKATKYQADFDAEMKPFKDDYDLKSSEIISSAEVLKTDYELRIKQLQADINAGKPLAQAQQEEAALKQELQKSLELADIELKGLYENFNLIQNEASKKYQTKLERDADAKTQYMSDRLQSLIKTYAIAAKENPDFVRDYKAAMEDAFILNDFTLRKAVKRTYEESQRTIGDNLWQSLNKTLGGSIESYGAGFGADWMRVYGKAVEASYTISPGKMESWKDALDVFNVAKLTGQLGGTALPSIAVGVATTYLTGGLGLPAAEAALVNALVSGVGQFTVNKMDVSNRVYQEMFQKTGNVDDALTASKQMDDLENSSILLNVTSALPYGNYFTFIKSPLLRGLTVGGISFAGDVLQETVETVGENTILNKKAPGDAFEILGDVFSGTGKVLLNKVGEYNFVSEEDKANAFQNYNLFKSTTIASSPMIFGGGASSIIGAKKESYQRSQASELGQKLFQEHLINNKSDYGIVRQKLALITMNKGKDYATMAANMMYQKGQIQTQEQLTSVLNSINASSELMQSRTVQKMNNEEKAIMVTLADIYQRGVIDLGKETDPIQKEILEKKLKETKAEIESFSTGKKTNLMAITMADGSVSIHTPEEIVSIFSESPELIGHITTQQLTVSPLIGEANETQLNAMELLGQKVKEFFTKDAPIEPVSTTETVPDGITIPTAAPVFATYNDAKQYVEQRAMEYARITGDENAFVQSKEYAELFPQIQSLHTTEMEFAMASPEKAVEMANSKGFSVGDKVSAEMTVADGVNVNVTGTVSIVNGMPVINLDEKQSTLSGDVVVPINDNWKVTESAKAKPTEEVAPATTEAAPTVTETTKPTEAAPATTAPKVYVFGIGERGGQSFNSKEYATDDPQMDRNIAYGKPNTGVIEVIKKGVKYAVAYTSKGLRDMANREGFLSVSIPIPEGATQETIDGLKQQAQDNLNKLTPLAKDGLLDSRTMQNAVSENIETAPTETPKTTEYAVQEQAAGQVPVQSEAGVSETMAQGKPEAEPQVAAEEGKVETATQAEAKPKAEEKVETAEQRKQRLADLAKNKLKQVGVKAPAITVNKNNIKEELKKARESKNAPLIKALEDTQKIINALGKKDTGVTIHLNQDTYSIAVENAGGNAESSLSNGFFVNKQGNIIHISIPSLTTNEAGETVLHEGAHPLLEHLAETDPKAIDNLYEQLLAQLENIPGIQAAIDFGKRYTGETQQKKEAIVQFLALVANGDINIGELPQTTLDKIIEFFKNLLSKIGIDFGIDINNSDDVITVAQKFSYALENARQIINKNKTEGVQFSLESSITSKNEILRQELDGNDINSLRASLRRKSPDSYTLQILDEYQSAIKNPDAIVGDENVASLLDSGISLSNIMNMLIEDGIFDTRKDVENYFISIGGQQSYGLFKRLAGAKTTGPQFSMGAGSRALIDFVDAARQDGFTDQEITDELKNQGYSDAAIEKALQGISMAPEGITPEEMQQFAEETKTRLRAVWSRISETYRGEGKEEAAQYIETNGKYAVRSQEIVYNTGKAILDMFNGKRDDAIKYIDENRLPPDLKVAVYGAAIINEIQGQRQPETLLERTGKVLENVGLKLSPIITELSELGTSYGQAISMFQYIYEMVPELFYQSQFNEHIAFLTDALGNPNQPNTAANNVVSTGKKAEKLRKDIFNQLANVLAGKADAVTLFEGGVDKLNSRMKRGLNILLGKTQEDKTMLSEMMRRLVNEGFVAKAETRAEAEGLIRDALRDMNPNLQTPLDTTEIQDLASGFVELYEEIAREKLTKLVESSFGKAISQSGKLRINAVVDNIFYGSLEQNDTLNKFAAMFGLPTITPAMKQQLTTMAANVVAARKQGAVAFKQAQTKFLQQLQYIQLKNKSGVAKLLGYAGRYGWLGESYLYNNVLLSVLTALRALAGNYQRVLRQFIWDAAKGFVNKDSAVGRKVMNNTFNMPILDVEYDAAGNLVKREMKSKAQIDIVDSAGNVIKVEEIELRPFYDNLYSSLRGLPRLAEVKRSGLNEAELKLRLMEKGFGKSAIRLLTTPASRLLSAIDSGFTPFSELLTKRQLYLAVLENAYKKAGITSISRLQMMDMIDEMMIPSTLELQKAAVQAKEDVINGPLYKQLGMTAFPDTDPRLKSKTFSKESKIYTEYIQRIYEIIDDGNAQRASVASSRYGWDQMFDINNVQKEVNDLSSKISSEITYLGQPRGTFGGAAKVFSNISNAFPTLKYFGIVPMFTNASMNAASFTIQYTPIINMFQYGAYMAKGKRGFFQNWNLAFEKASLTKQQKKWGMNYLNRADYTEEAVLKYDQKKMRDNVIATNTLALGLYVLLKGDDEEKRKKWLSGKGTGFTPLVLSKAQKSLGLKPGVLYYNGDVFFEYKDSAWQPFFAAVAFMTNEDVFTADPMSRAPFQNPKRTEQDEDFLSSLSSYFLFTMLTAADSSTMRSMTDTLNSLMELFMVSEKETEIAEAKVADAKQKFIKDKLANFASMFIPYKRLGGEFNAMYNTMMGNNKKKAITIVDKIFQNTMLSNWVLQAEETDYFGRPVKETFKLINPFAIGPYLEMGEAQTPPDYERPEGYGYGDKYLMLFGEMNYSPVTSVGDVLPYFYVPTDFKQVTVEEVKPQEGTEAEYTGYDEGSLTSKSKNYTTFIQNIENRYKGRIYTKEEVYPSQRVRTGGTAVNYLLTPQEAYMVNRLKGQFVMSILQHSYVNQITNETVNNFDIIKDLSPENFKNVMDRLYVLGKDMAISENIKDFERGQQLDFLTTKMTNNVREIEKILQFGVKDPKNIKLIEFPTDIFINVIKPTPIEKFPTEEEYMNPKFYRKK